MTHDHEHEREDIGCLEAIEMFYAYLDGELEGPESTEEFEHHLEHCRGCFSRLEFEGLLTERLKQAATEQAPEALRRRLKILMENF
jgi:anti-sigma factor (TIGR02949 family)